jgi:hypothetical protein
LPVTGKRSPRLIAEFPNEVVVCHDLLLANQDVALSLSRDVSTAIDLPNDPRDLRRLPWVRDVVTQDPLALTGNALWGTVFLAVLVVLPGATVMRLIRKRRWTLRMMFWLPVLLALGITILTADLPFLSSPLHRISGRLVWMLALTPVAALVGLLAHHAYRKQWRWLIGWLAVTLAITAALGGLFLLLDIVYRPLAPGERYLWKGWYLLWMQAAYLTGIAAIAVVLCKSVIQVLAGPTHSPQNHPGVG